MVRFYPMAITERPCEWFPVAVHKQGVTWGHQPDARSEGAKQESSDLDTMESMQWRKSKMSWKPWRAVLKESGRQVENRWGQRRVQNESNSQLGSEGAKPLCGGLTSSFSCLCAELFLKYAKHILPFTQVLPVTSHLLRYVLCKPSLILFSFHSSGCHTGNGCSSLT